MMKNWPLQGEISSRRGINDLGDLWPLHRRHVAAAIFLLSAVGCIPVSARAQFGGHALPTATRVGDLQLGGGLVLGNSDYNFNSTRLVGAGFYTTFDVRAHLGAEANIRQTRSSLDSTVYERTYQIGPRVYFARGIFAPYAKVLVGRGVYNFSNSVANVAYNMYTYGGGADFEITRSLNVRGDYEYQTWLGFPLADLHPSVVTIGVAYHFHE